MRKFFAAVPAIVAALALVVVANPAYAEPPEGNFPSEVDELFDSGDWEIVDTIEIVGFPDRVSDPEALPADAQKYYLGLIQEALEEGYVCFHQGVTTPRGFNGHPSSDWQKDNSALGKARAENLERFGQEYFPIAVLRVIGPPDITQDWRGVRLYRARWTGDMRPPLEDERQATTTYYVDYNIYLDVERESFVYFGPIGLFLQNNEDEYFAWGGALMFGRRSVVSRLPINWLEFSGAFNVQESDLYLFGSGAYKRRFGSSPFHWGLAGRATTLATSPDYHSDWFTFGGGPLVGLSWNVIEDGLLQIDLGLDGHFIASVNDRDGSFKTGTVASVSFQAPW